MARKWLMSLDGHFAPTAALLSLPEMNGSPKLSQWQVFRTRLHLFAVAVRKRLTVGVRAVLIMDRSVLLIRHTYVPGWHFPGGGVEPGETAEAAAAREAAEETGYGVAGRPVLHGLFLNRVAGGRRDHVAVYLWRTFRAQRAFSPNIEIAECRWFPIDALPADIEPGTARRIDEIFAGAAAADEW